MKRWYGYAGRILEIDLGSASTTRSDPDEKMVNQYLGGKGFGTKILHERLAPRVDPLSPENILVFATGPLTGTLAPASGRFEVCTKSPATGLWLDSNCGGFFGPELKFAGYDMLIIKGKAENPVLLTIDNDRVELKPAKNLWGLDTITTHKWIKDQFGKDYRVACIGPAGEKCVRYASIISEYRALGRGGAGAVMGAKNLKAIAVRGSQSIAIAEPDKFMKTCREAFNELANHPDTGGGRPKYGTNVILSVMEQAGLHPVRNFQKVKFDGAGTLNEETIARLYTRNRACFGCPIYCSKIAEVKDGKYRGSFTEGPEYENVWAYATSDRGGCHLRAWPIGEELLATEQRMDLFSTEFKPELVKTQQDLFCLINCIGMCLFATFALNLKQITPFLHSATGIEAFSSSEHLLDAGERVNNLVRLFNIRRGLTKDMDTLPERFFKEPLTQGPGKGKVVDLEQMKAEYYSVRGWDADGVPTANKLKELGM